MSTLTRIEFEDIEAGDTIALGIDTAVDRGVALQLEPLFDDDPEAPEMVWYFDGMSPLGNWMKACDVYRVED